MNSPLAIDVTGLNKHFGDKHAVCDLSLQIRRGEIFGFLGPNGSGKTTSIRLLCGLLKPDSGSGTCLDYDIIRETPSIKREVGYMTQRFSLWEDLTIRENLEFVARLYGLKNRAQSVAQAIDKLGLTVRQNQLAGELSGGWKQRLALASCMLHQPRLLLLDEPTAGVDPKARRDFWEEISELSASGITVLVSTHYMDEAERCHRLAYLAYGHLLISGSAQEVVDSQALTGYEVTGPEPAQYAKLLRGLPGVDRVTAFGTILHVIGRDADALNETAERMRKAGSYEWTRIRPGLEDIFIGLMETAKDNCT